VYICGFVHVWVPYNLDYRLEIKHGRRVNASYYIYIIYVCVCIKWFFHVNARLCVIFHCHVWLRVSGGTFINPNLLHIAIWLSPCMWRSFLCFLCLFMLHCMSSVRTDRWSIPQHTIDFHKLEVMPRHHWNGGEAMPKWPWQSDLIYPLTGQTTSFTSSKWWWMDHKGIARLPRFCLQRILLGHTGSLNTKEDASDSKLLFTPQSTFPNDLKHLDVHSS